MARKTRRAVLRGLGGGVVLAVAGAGHAAQSPCPGRPNRPAIYVRVVRRPPQGSPIPINNARVEVGFAGRSVGPTYRQGNLYGFERLPVGATVEVRAIVAGQTRYLLAPNGQRARFTLGPCSEHKGHTIEFPG